MRHIQQPTHNVVMFPIKEKYDFKRIGHLAPIPVTVFVHKPGSSISAHMMTKRGLVTEKPASIFINPEPTRIAPDGKGVSLEIYFDGDQPLSRRAILRVIKLFEPFIIGARKPNFWQKLFHGLKVLWSNVSHAGWNRSAVSQIALREGEK